MATTLAPDDDLPRQLIVCCDGTNNTLTAGIADTNVLHLVEHLGRHRAANRIVYYDPGVGTPAGAPPTDPMDWAQRTWERISGLASGRGVYDNIGKAYLFLMRHWRDERDRIYVFGFSRGAFTVRGVAGMVHLFGILKPEYDVLIPTLIRIYFSQEGDGGGWLQKATHVVHQSLQHHTVQARAGGDQRSAVLRANDGLVSREKLGRQIRNLCTTPAGSEAWVHWIGLWDTVQSVGLPGPLSKSNPSTATLHDKRFRHVRHALAFDEHRWTFEPTLYQEPGDIDNGRQTLKQRWFAGDHCDVGGSYPKGDRRLPDEALQWMIAEVSADLDIPPLPAHDAPRVRHDALWDTPWWALAGMCLRDMHPKTERHPIRRIAIIPGPWAAIPSASVWEMRRSVWPVLIAIVLGAVSLLLSGACLLGPGWHALFEPGGLQAAALAPGEFALDQFRSITGLGLFRSGVAPWDLRAQPGWSLFWDSAFIACWGYLLARVASRAFAWLAGARGPTSPRPWWRWLGMAPLIAVGGDACENLSTLLAMLAHAAGTDLIAAMFLWYAGVLALMKFAGLVLCVPLVLVRLWIAMPWVPISRGPAQAPSAVAIN